MNYEGKKVAVTGTDGFLGSEIVARLRQLGAAVYEIEGDVKDGETFKDLDHTFDYLFHFAAPSSQVLFQRSQLYSAIVTLNGFINAAVVCKANGIKLIYPSTGTLSQGATNEYARCKAVLEDIHKGENLDAIGLRIFAAYGSGEYKKRDYASVPYLFIDEMLEGKRPQVFGDGKQERDFIYVHDAVEMLLHIADEAPNGIYDVGSGEPISFNEIIRMINDSIGDDIQAEYFGDAIKPKGYPERTLANTETHKYWKPTVTMKSGINAVVKTAQLRKEPKL